MKFNILYKIMLLPVFYEIYFCIRAMTWNLKALRFSGRRKVHHMYSGQRNWHNIFVQHFVLKNFGTTLFHMKKRQLNRFLSV